MPGLKSRGHVAETRFFAPPERMLRRSGATGYGRTGRGIARRAAPGCTVLGRHLRSCREPRVSVQPSIVGLRGFGMLASLPETRLAELAAQCNWRRVSAGEHLVRRDAHDRDVHLIVGGRVRVTVSTLTGRQISYKDLGSGSVVGVLAAIDGEARSTDVLALEETLVATLAPDDFNALLRESRPVNEWMLKALVTMVRELSDRVFEVSALGVQNRVHAEVLRMAREAGVAGNRAVIDPAPPHPDIASRVSTYREQVTRELSTMTRQGLIERAGHAWVVPDVARLESIVAEVRRLA